MKKLLKKFGGSLILICAVFMNVLNVNAATLSVSSSTNKSHSLGFIQENNADFSEGKTTLEIVGVTNNVLTVKYSIINVGEGGTAGILTNLNTEININDNVYNNFTIAIGSDNSAHGAPLLSENVINWSIGTLAEGETAYMTYTITPMATVEESVKNINLPIAASVLTNLTNAQDGSLLINYDSSIPGCIPLFTYADSGSTPDTGLFTNMILLVGIVGAAGGILVISLKNNKFQNI